MVIKTDAGSRQRIVSATIAIALIACMAWDCAFSIGPSAWAAQGGAAQDSAAMDTAVVSADSAQEDAQGEGAGESSAPQSPPSNSSPELEELEDGHITTQLEPLRASLDGKLAELEAAASRFEERWGALRSRSRGDGDALMDARMLIDKLTDIELRRIRALKLVEAVQREQELGEDGTLAVLLNTGSVADAQRRQEMLDRLLATGRTQVARLLEEKKLLNAQAALDGALASHEDEAVIKEAAEINALAYAVERMCADMRQGVKDAREVIAGLEASEKSQVTVAHDASARCDTAMMAVERAEALLGAWYDEAELRGGVEGAISFGVGGAFCSGEEEFVERWGVAIDAFYREAAASSGPMPLEGYGASIAASAYRHKIDPRLCAAVSIVESSGGRECIRPFNAWGWGAADRDPYKLAAEWASWDEAIEAWHAGVAGSTTGLASAPCVSAFGVIYCSSPAWGSSVIACMERIGAHAGIDGDAVG